MFWSVIHSVAVMLGILHMATSVCAAEPAVRATGDGIVELRQRVAEERADGSTILEVSVMNKSRVALEDVSVSGRVPTGYTLAGATRAPERIQQELLWAMGRFQAGEERIFQLQFAPLRGGAAVELRNPMRVRFRGTSENEFVAPPKRKELQVSVECPGVVALNASVPLRIRIANPGSHPVVEVALEAALPEGLSHPRGRDLEYPIGTIEPGKTREISLDLNADKLGEYRGKIRIREAGGASVEHEFVVRVREVKLVLTATGPRESGTRSAVTLEFQARNDGTEVVPQAGAKGFMSFAADKAAILPDGLVRKE